MSRPQRRNAVVGGSMEGLAHLAEERTTAWLTVYRGGTSRIDGHRCSVKPVELEDDSAR
jgi:hypothetical protein